MAAWWRVLGVARPHALRVVAAVLVGALALGCGVALIATSAWLISRAALRPPVLTLTVAIVAVRAFGVGRGVFRYTERLVGHDAALRVLGDLRVDLYARLERLAPAGLPAFRSGELLSRLVADVEDVQDVLVRGVVPVGAAALVTLASVAFVAWLLPAAAVALSVGVLAAVVLAPTIALLVGRAQETRLAPLRGQLSAAALDIYQGAGELAVYGAGPRFVARLSTIDGDLRRAQARSAAASGLGALVSGSALAGTVVASAALGVDAVRSGAVPGEALAVLVLLPLALFEALSLVAPAGLVLTRAERSVARLREVAVAAPPVVDPATPVPLPGGPYDLVLRAVSVSWPRATSPAARVAHLDLEPGGRLAVSGPSGAGKTTLAFALVRFLDHEGDLRLGGVETRRLAADDVRSQVGLCAQDAHVFDTTLEANLLLARPEATPDQLRAALAAARMTAFVDSLPQGLQTLVGEHGARLSGGQRQRLAVARAVLAGFAVLVLDEPGEHLDEPTASALIRDVLAAAALADTALVLISHRHEGLEGIPRITLGETGGRWGEVRSSHGTT